MAYLTANIRSQYYARLAENKLLGHRKSTAGWRAPEDSFLVDSERAKRALWHIAALAEESRIIKTGAGCMATMARISYRLEVSRPP